MSALGRDRAGERCANVSGGPKERMEQNFLLKCRKYSRSWSKDSERSLLGGTPSEELLAKAAVLSDFKGHFADVRSVRVILEFLTEEPRQCLDIPAPLLFLLGFMLWRHPAVAVESCSRGIRKFLSTQHPFFWRLDP